MAEEKQSPIGIIVVVAVIAVVAGIFLFKGGGNGDQNAGNQQQPTNGPDTKKTAPQPEPKKLPPNAVKFNGNAYVHYPERVTWKEAQKKCEELGGHLVIIDSKEENDFIAKTLFKGESGLGGAQNTQKWIGAYANSSDEFVWVAPNGKKVSETYDNWWVESDLPVKKDHPQYGPYAHIAPVHHLSRASGSWTNDHSFFGTVFELGFICEWEKSKK